MCGHSPEKTYQFRLFVYEVNQKPEMYNSKSGEVPFSRIQTVFTVTREFRCTLVDTFIILPPSPPLQSLLVPTFYVLFSDEFIFIPCILTRNNLQMIPEPHQST